MNRRYRLSKKYGTTGPCYRARPGYPLVFVDLGKRKVGWAVFIGGELAHCGTSTLSMGVRWEPDLTAMLVVREVEKATGLKAKKMDWVYEDPHLRQGFRVAKDAIEALTEVRKSLGRKVGGFKEKYRPAEWKGTIPKRVHHLRVWNVLNEEERLLVPSMTEHDTWDAVGGGLFAVGRVGTGGLP